MTRPAAWEKWSVLQKTAWVRKRMKRVRRNIDDSETLAKHWKKKDPEKYQRQMKKIEEERTELDYLQGELDDIERNEISRRKIFKRLHIK